MQSEWRELTEQESGSSLPGVQPPFGTFAPNAVQSMLIRFARATILRRGMFRAKMTGLVHALGKGKLDIGFRGASFRLYGERNLIEYGLLLVPEYNRADTDFLLQGAPPDACFVDVGCNIGLYALPLASARPNGRVIAVDANPLMVARIAWNATAGRQTNLTIVHAAVSDHEGWADLVIRKGDVAIVAVRENDAGNMPVCTLASIVDQAGLKRIDGLKIDIEGHEDRALVPFLDQCPSHLLPARIVIEKSGPDQDYPGCTGAFARHGYRLVGRTRNNSLYMRDSAVGRGAVHV